MKKKFNHSQSEKSVVPVVQAWESFIEDKKVPSLEDFAYYLLENQASDSASEKQIHHMQAPHLGSMAGFLIARLFKFIRHYSKEVLNPHGIQSLDEFGFLASLDRVRYLADKKTEDPKDEGISKKELCEMNMTELTTGYDIIKRLKKKGLLLEKLDKADKRARKISLSPEGNQVLFKCYQALGSIDHLLASLVPLEQEQLIHMLQKLDQYHSFRWEQADH